MKILKFLLFILASIIIFSCTNEEDNNNNNQSTNITYLQIPAGAFIMGSTIGEVNRTSDETQFQVTLSAFKMSKYEITNAQYAAFLNTKNIDSSGLCVYGAFPAEVLIYASTSPYDWGLHYTSGQWLPVAGYENHPVIFVTWFGATEFATYVGGRLPTEAQWEYACRGNTTTPFNTGNCLSDAQANYNWTLPYSTCTNTSTTYPNTTQAVGSYSANAYGLFDMHGNVYEWCSDWSGTYPTTAQTNPTGAITGTKRVIRGGSFRNGAQYSRSANRGLLTPSIKGYDYGFRVVINP